MFIRKKLFPLVRYVSNYSSIRPNSLPFARAKKGTFFQQSPFLENSFEGDAFLQRNLKRILSNDVTIILIIIVEAVGFVIPQKKLHRSFKAYRMNCLCLEQMLPQRFTGLFLIESHF